MALPGDALHNLSDVSTSFVVFLGFWVSKKQPSLTHPYGYEWAEDSAGLGVAVVILASAIFAAVQSYQKLISNAGTTSLGFGMAAASWACLATWASLDTRRMWRARSTRSRWKPRPTTPGSTRFHHSMMHVSWEVTREILGHLMDGVEQEHIEAAQKAAAGVPGLLDVRVRGRWIGRSLTLEVEGQLPADTSLARAEQTVRAVEDAVRGAVEDVRHVQWIPRRAS